MEKELALQILGLRELADEGSVRAAYMERLKGTNPEDDPEGFRRLREAYEKATTLLREKDESGEEAEKTDIDLWIDRVDEVYRNFISRGDERAWRELFADPVCQDLDTSLEARDAMLNYLLSHFYLPKEIWRCLDREFQILEDYDELKERYPEDFLGYIRHYTENDYFIRFDRLCLRDGARMEDVNVDGYIRTFMDRRSCFEHGEYEEARKKLEELPAYGIWYPWEDAERMNQEQAEGHAEEAARLADNLAKRYLSRLGDSIPDEDVELRYILSCVGNVKWETGDKETAFRCWQLTPDSFDSKIGMIKYYLENEETAENAKDLALDIWEQDGSSQRVEEYVSRANEMLIRRYEREIEQLTDPEKQDDRRLEIAWCCYQDRKFTEALKILDGITVTEGLSYGYHNLRGRVLPNLERYQEAVADLRQWLSMILATADDGSEEAKKRLRRKGTAYFMLGFCLCKSKEYEEAIEMLKRGVEEIQDVSERLGCMNTLAETYLAKKEYELAADQCDQVLAQDKGYYPAYINRQEAYFRMDRGQGVVDDYYNAINIFAGFYKPYLLAAKVFFFAGQYEDAKGVFERAKENKVEFSDEMKLYQVKVMRNLAREKKEREEPRQILEDLQKSMRADDTDMEDISEIEYETAILDWDDNELDSALEHLNKAIRRNPNRLQYFMIRGEIQRGAGDYKKALLSYGAAKEQYDETAGYYYGRAACYAKLGEEEKALENYLKARGINIKFRDVNEMIADIYMDRYRRSCGHEDYQKAILYVDQEVKNWEGCYILVHRGLMHAEAMELEKALADYEKALTFNPDDWAAFNNMGYCYKQLSRFDKAIECYEKSLEILREKNEKRLLPYSNLADIYEILGDYGRAIDCYKKDLEWYPDETFLYREIADLYFYLGDYKNAVSYYKTAGEKWNIKRHLIRIGDVCFAQGKVLKAKNMYKKAIQTAAGNIDAYERYNDYAERLMENMFDYRKALEILQRAEHNRKNLAGWKADTEDRAENERYQARAYYFLDRIKEAAEHAKKAKALYLADTRSEKEFLEYPASRPLHLSKLGECYLYMGEREKALELFEQMDRGYRCKFCRYKSCYEKYRNLGLYYLLAEPADKKTALQNYEKALELCPHDMELQEMVKKLCKETGR